MLDSVKSLILLQCCKEVIINFFWFFNMATLVWLTTMATREEDMACFFWALLLLSSLCSRFSIEDEGAQLNLSVPTVLEKSRKSVCFLWKSVRSKYQNWYGALKHARPPAALRNLWKSITAGVGCKLSFKSKQGLRVFTALCRERLEGTTSSSVLL